MESILQAKNTFQEIISVKKTLKGIPGDKILFVYASGTQFVLKITDKCGVKNYASLAAKNISDPTSNKIIMNIVKNACIGIDPVSSARITKSKMNFLSYGNVTKGSKIENVINFLSDIESIPLAVVSHQPYDLSETISADDATYRNVFAEELKEYMQPNGQKN